MTPLLRTVTKMKCSIPASRASSTTYWRIGRSTTVSISFGIVLVAGRKRVPRPATGSTALRMGLVMGWGFPDDETKTEAPRRHQTPAPHRPLSLSKRLSGIELRLTIGLGNARFLLIWH